MPVKGIDYAFNPHPSVAAMKAAGVHWAGRYVSPIAANDHNGKNILPAECQALLAGGIEIILFAEQYASRIREGHSAGAADAHHFDGVVKSLHMPTIAMYCCADYDAPPGDQNEINAYLDGAASVIGRDRVGIYGSYYVCKRTLDAKKAHYACQTVAWSGGQWLAAAHVRQHLQIRVGGISVDFDEAFRDDFGQWPRPDHPAPKPAKPTKMTADGKRSLRQLAHAHGTTVNRALWLMSQDPDKVKKGGWGKLQAAYLAEDDFDKVAPKGMVYWVG